MKTTETDKPTLFKDWYNSQLVIKMASELKACDPSFDTKLFTQLCRWDDETPMKARVSIIRAALQQTFKDQPFRKTVTTLLKCAEKQKLTGFALWPFADFIKDNGHSEFDLALQSLCRLTPLFTAEFAVRPYLRVHQQATLDFLLDCAESPNEHVRRWASEGSRPRLPWGERLHEFVKNPEHTLQILFKLRFDPSLYVRKSVANHLNDIGKDHPKKLIEVLKKWSKDVPKDCQKNWDWVVRHALRTRIKAGDKAALQLLGFKPVAQVEVQSVKLMPKTLNLGESLEFTFDLVSKAKSSQALVIDYVLHFAKKNGKASPKVFKLKTLTLKPAETISLKKRHAIKPITTRKYYSGTQALEIQINGQRFGEVAWKLKV